VRGPGSAGMASITGCCARAMDIGEFSVRMMANRVNAGRQREGNVLLMITMHFQRDGRSDQYMAQTTNDYSN